LTSAGELLAERGFHTTQVPDIARNAGLSVGAFYRYFDDKRAVFVELLHRVLAQNRNAQRQFLDEWRRRIASGEANGRAFLDAAMEQATRQHAVPPELMRRFVAMSYEDETVGALRRAYDRSERRDLARFIAAVTPRAAVVLDVAVDEVVRWASLEGGRGAGAVRAALVEMLHRYLFA